MRPETGSSFTFFVAINSDAPRDRASAFLESVEEKTVTAQPFLAANWIARWPRPPTPMMPTRSEDVAPKDERAFQTVAMYEVSFNVHD
jgi:hypothetical protein